MKYCEKCNREYEDKFGFCMGCGSKLVMKGAPAPAPAPAPTPGPAPSSGGPQPGPQPQPQARPQPMPGAQSTPSSAGPAPAPAPGSAPGPRFGGQNPSGSAGSSSSAGPQPGGMNFGSPSGGQPGFGGQVLPGSQPKASGGSDSLFKVMLIVSCVLAGLLVMIGAFCLVSKLVLHESPLVVLGLVEEGDGPIEEEPDDGYLPPDAPADPEIIEFGLDLPTGSVDGGQLPTVALSKPLEEVKLPKFKERGNMGAELNYIIGTSNLNSVGTCSIGGRAKTDYNAGKRNISNDSEAYIYKNGNGLVSYWEVSSTNADMNNSNYRKYYGENRMLVESYRADGLVERIFFNGGKPFCYTVNNGEIHTYEDSDWKIHYNYCLNFDKEYGYYRNRYGW